MASNLVWESRKLPQRLGIAWHTLGALLISTFLQEEGNESCKGTGKVMCNRIFKYMLKSQWTNIIGTTSHLKWIYYLSDMPRKKMGPASNFLLFFFLILKATCNRVLKYMLKDQWTNIIGTTSYLQMNILPFRHATKEIGSHIKLPSFFSF